MRRRSFLTMLSTLPWAAQAQQSAPPYRVGYVTGSSLAGRATFIAAFRRSLGERGYSEGQNLALDLRAADGRFATLPGLVHELIALKPDVIFATTTPAALAAKAVAVAVGIPVVFAAVADPLGVGLVDNLARPDGKITGVTNIAAELAGKRLQYLHELVPAAGQIAILVNPDDANATLQLRSAEAAANELSIRLGPILDIRAPGDVAKAVSAAAGAGARAALRLVDPTLAQLRTETIEAATQHRLPVMYPFREDVEAGGLVSYGTDLGGQYAQAATLVARILGGTHPSHLPVEQASTFELVLNLKAAKALGLTVPPALLLRADKVIE